MTNLKKIFYILSLNILLFIPFFSTHAQLNKAFSNDSLLNVTANRANYDTSNNLDSTFASIILLILEIVGSIFLILIIYSGIEWMTAGGNEQRAQKASSMLKSSIIGLIIVLGAYAISYYVIKTLGANLIH